MQRIAEEEEEEDLSRSLSAEATLGAQSIEVDRAIEVLGNRDRLLEKTPRPLFLG